MQTVSRSRLLALFAALLVALSPAGTLTSLAAPPPVPRYDHIFLVIYENHGYSQIIGNTAAPNMNALANSYGLATQYFSVADPSEPNYVAMLGGNFFGINNDNAYYLTANTVDKPSLMSQLEQAGLTWKGYLQSMPYAGYRGICFPVKCAAVPDLDPLYAAKHNGAVNFKSIQASNAEFAKMVPYPDLAEDLAINPPNFGFIVPDECTDMHGAPSNCVDSGNNGDTLDNRLVGQGDQFAATVVQQITTADFWSKGNNAIIITFDEGNGTQGCCDANPGTGRIATIVITSNGPRGVKDNTPYNHYSLLQTMQDAFGLGCLEFTCDTANVTPMANLLAVSH